MAGRKRQSILHGSLILIAGVVVVKVIGALFKIPMTNLITSAGMGYFGSAYTIFTVIQTVAAAGFPVAISRMVAEAVEQRRFRDVKRIYSLSLKVFLITGILGTALMVVISPFMVNAMKNEKALPAMLVMAPAVFFSCMLSVNRGYFQGLSNMIPTAVSQIIEAASKLVLGLLFANMTLNYAMNQFFAGGLVFGTAVHDEGGALAAAYPYAAAAAVLAVVLGSAFAACYMFIRRRFAGDGITSAEYNSAPPPMTGGTVLKSMLAISVPIAAAALTSQISSFIDAFTFQNITSRMMQTDPDAILSMWGRYLPVGMSPGDVSNSLYGIYSAYALTVFHLVPTVTASIGISALPAVTVAFVNRNMASLRNNIEAGQRFTLLIAVPAGLGMAVLAEPLLTFAFKNTAEASIAAPLLQIMGVASIFLCINLSAGAMLQAMGKSGSVMLILMFSAIIKFTLNFVLISIPALNILGAPVASLASYVFMTVCCIATLKKSARTGIRWLRLIMPIFAAGIICALFAYCAYGILGRFMDNRLNLLVSIGFSGIIYVVLLFSLRIITKKDVLLLPKGEKISKALEKRGLIR